MTPTLKTYRSVGELFLAMKTLSKNADKVSLLQMNASPALFYILKLAYHPDVKWLLPEGAPPYKKDGGAPGLTPSVLMRELRTFYLYLEGGTSGLNQFRREKMFTLLLERLHESEVELVLALKDNTFNKVFKCSKTVVDQAFPGLLETAFAVEFR